MFWRITRDYLTPDESDEFCRKGFGHGSPDANSGEILHFSLYDDDGECYYVGICDRASLNAPEDNYASLYTAYVWAMHDAGATDLRVNGESIYG